MALQMVSTEGFQLSQVWKNILQKTWGASNKGKEEHLWIPTKKPSEEHLN